MKSTKDETQEVILSQMKVDEEQKENHGHQTPLYVRAHLPGITSTTVTRRKEINYE
jgi:hypothetical protein